MADDPDLTNLVSSTLIPHTAFDKAAKRIWQSCNFGLQSNDPVCIAVVGESRTGKSRLLEECSAAFPPSRSSDGVHMPVISLSTPSKPTVKGLAAHMLRAIGDPRHAEGTEIAKTARLHRLMKEIGSRVLLIDEFQHFHDKGTNEVMHHVADWLKILVDETKIVLIVSGLPSCRQVIDQNEQLSGRFLAPLVMPRFRWDDPYLREEFLAILAAFQEALSPHFEIPDMRSDEMGFRIFCATGGLMGYITRLLRQLVWNAMIDERRVMSLSDFARAHGDCHWEREGAPMLHSFSPGFKASPNQDLIRQASMLGTKQERHVPRRSGIVGSMQKSSVVLSAR